ncbi:MAG: hypothetical protein L6W00_13720 [Lentisphaeria bacterium]|nr:MAG: hypothetical protein L6W00_13720 [Lentisphaeria bacterium]
MDQRKYKKSNRDKSPRGRLLIQHYIYDLQTRSGGESRQLPSSRELAAQFGGVALHGDARTGEAGPRRGADHETGVGTFLAPAEKTGPLKNELSDCLSATAPTTVTMNTAGDCWLRAALP